MLNRLKMNWFYRGFSMTAENEEKKDELKKESPEVPDSDKALDSVVSNMSQINPDVLNREKKEVPDSVLQTEKGFSPDKPKEKKRKPVKGVTDKHGQPFNPEIHESDSEGRPVINKKDGFLKLKPGRHKNPDRQYSGASPKAAASPSSQVEIDEVLTQRRYAAEISSSLFINTGVMVFGQEWLPRKSDQIDEHRDVTGYFEKYFEVKGISDIPPGLALALGLIGYGAVRLHLPETRSRMQIIVDALKVKMFKAWNWIKKIRTKKNASHVNIGND